jgi:hypothetical protein
MAKNGTSFSKDNPGPGRAKGVPNKATIAAKTAFQMAFDKIGGWERLAEWAASDNDNLKEFYKLYSKLIPQDVTSGGDRLPSVTINVPPIDGGPQL